MPLVSAPPRIGPWSPVMGPRKAAATTLEAMLPAVSFRAPRFQKAAIDDRFNPALTGDDLRRIGTSHPVVLRADVFAGMGAPDDQTRCVWTYTERPEAGRYLGGTSPGGLVFLPPEVGLEDYASSLVPGHPTSSAFVAFGPGVSTAYGVPDLRNGGWKTGWTTRRDSSTENLVTALVASSVSTDAFRISKNYRPGWTDGTAFWGDLSHANTADRDYAFPNASGRVPIVLATAYASATVSNTNVETTIVGTVDGSLTLPANSLTVGKTLRIRARGYHSVDASPPDLTIRVRIGGAEIATTGAFSDKLATEEEWEITAEVTCRSVGAGGTVYAGGNLTHHENAATGDHYFLADPAGPTHVGSVNTTIANAVDLTAQWSFAEASASITGAIFTLEIL